MTPHHHPCEATLLAYSFGNLPEASALAVACHLTFCRPCRRTAELVDVVGGILLDELPPDPLAGDRLERTMAQLAANAQAATAADDRAVAGGPEWAWMPEPLRRYLPGRWSWIGPGAKQIIVVRRDSQGSSARLLRLAPRAALPDHGHTGVELACVLRGSFSDERGRFTAGDLCEAGPGFRHQPVAGSEDGCICLLATSGSLQLFGMLGRLAQWALGF